MPSHAPCGSSDTLPAKQMQMCVLCRAYRWESAGALIINMMMMMIINWAPNHWLSFPLRFVLWSLAQRSTRFFCVCANCARLVDLSDRWMKGGLGGKGAEATQNAASLAFYNSTEGWKIMLGIREKSSVTLRWIAMGKLNRWNFSYSLWIFSLLNLCWFETENGNNEPVEPGWNILKSDVGQFSATSRRIAMEFSLSSPV